MQSIGKKDMHLLKYVRRFGSINSVVRNNFPQNRSLLILLGVNCVPIFAYYVSVQGKLGVSQHNYGPILLYSTPQHNKTKARGRPRSNTPTPSSSLETYPMLRSPLLLYLQRCSGRFRNLQVPQNELNRSLCPICQAKLALSIPGAISRPALRFFNQSPIAAKITRKTWSNGRICALVKCVEVL